MSISDLKIKLLTKLSPVTRMYYNDPPNSPPPASPPPASPPPPPASPPSPPPPGSGEAKFTQADVDRLMQEHRKGLQNQNKELIDQLEQLRTTSNLTAQEKDALQARIDSLSQQHLTKEQQAAEALTKLQKKLDAETKKLIDEGASWKTRFEKTMVENALAVAANEHHARSAKQLQMMFGNQAKVMEKLDNEGKPTGEWEARMTVEVIDEKTKQKVTLDLPVVEAIGKIKEIEEYTNLFNADGRNGLGGNNFNHRLNNGSNGMPDFAKMSTEDYAKWRKANPATQTQ